MKIQCNCGAKYSFDVTPEMAATPVRFVCAQCGLDSSSAVNQLIRQQLGASGVQPAAPPPPAPAVALPARPVARVPAATPATAAPAPPPPPAASAPALRVSGHAAPAPASPPAEVPPAQPCLKHVGEFTTHQCFVCGKPICPKCLELFGYLCSAYCKGQAEKRRLEVPFCASQRTVVEAKSWRKVRLVAAGIVAALLALVGVWVWYEWVGSVPHVVFSVPFPEKAQAGQCQLLPGNQTVWLHHGRLARHDVKAKKEVWSADLIDKEQIARQAAQTLDEMKAAYEKAKKKASDPDDLRELRDLEPPDLKVLTEEMAQMQSEELRLHVHGEAVWVAFLDKLVKYDWQTGKAAQEVPVKNRFANIVSSDAALLVIAERGSDQPGVTRIDLATGETKTAAPAVPAVAAVSTGKLLAAGAKGAKHPARTNDPLAALVANPGGVPAFTAARAVNLRLQQRSEQALAVDDDGDETPTDFAVDRSRGELIAAGPNVVEFSVKLLESKTERREAMKAPPKKSALDGPINQAATAAIANEILNDIQRDRTEGVELEDVSRYNVTLRRLLGDPAPEWSGEVTGPPDFFPLKTVDVLIAGKAVLVFDKSNKKLWESKLNYAISAGGGFLDDFYEDEGPARFSPCVERGDTLHLFDQGVLTAFDLATGNARWRLPSVGISRLHFDDQGMIYVNTTTAPPEKIKFSQQIDITQKTLRVVLKVEAKTGKILWKKANRGWVSHVSGKFIYAVESHPGEDWGALSLGTETPAHVRIYRLDAGNGRDLWEHYQKRFPLDVSFRDKTIQLLFRKEMQVLKFMAF